MQVLTYVIAGLYTLKWFGICSEVSNQNISDENPIKLVTSRHLGNEEQIYLETTEISVNETLNQNSSTSYAEDFMKPKLLISDPLFEDMSMNTSARKELSRKRNVPERGLSHANKMKLLQLHNIYRGNVTPPAGNMAYMEWDDELARLAQVWADGCLFEHGMPDNDYPETIGQNLYIGTDPTGYLGLYLWYEEYHHYDLRKSYCEPGKQCGHYIQMAWSLSNKLGCGMTKCDMRYLIVCHYSPQALRGIHMYRVAHPCSQCPPKEGTLCLENLCMTSEQCENNPFDCQFAKCNLECMNCGRLNKEKCLCECVDGWDSPDCSYLCTDKHVRCNKSPGWPTKASCSMNNNAVAKTHCRKMCEMCNPVDVSISNYTCCDGKLCDEGFILDSQNSCKCKLLCPGPLCDSEDAGEYQALLENSANCLNRIPYFAQWIIVFTLHFRIRIL